MVRKTALTLGLSLLLVTPFGAQAEVQNPGGYSKELKSEVEHLKKQELAKVVKEASLAVWETQRALVLLQKGQKEEALNLLKKVYSRLEKLEREYGLKSLPIDVEIEDISTVLDLKTAQEYNKRVKQLTAENDFVDARFILNLLRDEVDINTTYLPLDVYKKAIALATRLLEEGKVNPAVLVLESALSTLEIETTVVPKPPIRALVLVKLAEKIYKIDPSSALKLLEEAKEELKMTVALGYARSEEDLKPVEEALAQLEKAVKERLANAGEKFKETEEKLRRLKENLTVSHQ
jgi:tetratricopeptide (TPR) repeat protein